MRISFMLAAAIAAIFAGHAEAHARLLHASPKVGATVTWSPTELRLWFSETIQPSLSRITLVSGDGRPVRTGRLALDPKDKRVVVLPLLSALATGTYRVSWETTSEDTHNTDGDFVFKVGP